MIVVKYRDDRFRTGSATDEIFQNTHGIAFVFVVVLAEFIDKDNAHGILYARMVRFSSPEIKKYASLYMACPKSRTICICGPQLYNKKIQTEEKGFKCRDISYYDCHAFETLPF